MADRGATWRNFEIQVLLEIWSDKLIQSQLSGSYRNETVFQAISDQLERQTGIRRTVKQCRDKIKSLKKKYKEIIDKLRKSGVGVDSDEEFELWNNWKWFDPIHKMMKKRPSVNPVGLLEIGRSSRPDTPASISSDTSHLSCSEDTLQLDTPSTSSSMPNMPSAS